MQSPDVHRHKAPVVDRYGARAPAPVSLSRSWKPRDITTGSANSKNVAVVVSYEAQHNTTNEDSAASFYLIFLISFRPRDDR